jgi:hypothetical protein
MKMIGLSNGGVAIVDDADFDTLSRWRWTRHPKGYATRTATRGKILMHRQILGEPIGDVDHRNRDKLDNTRANLRVVTRSENMHNRPKQSNNTSGLKGVSWDPIRRRWRASIKVAGRHHMLGRFATRAEAASAYDAAATRLVGECAGINGATEGLSP